MTLEKVIWRGKYTGNINNNDNNNNNNNKQASKNWKKQTNKQKQSNANFENLWTQGPIIYLSLSLDTVKPCQNLACYQGFEKEIIIRPLSIGLQILVKTGVRKFTQAQTRVPEPSFSFFISLWNHFMANLAD